MASIEEIAATLRSIATPGMKPKALRAAIRERYPEANKKEIVRAAFYAMTETSPVGQDPPPPGCLRHPVSGRSPRQG